MLLNKKIISIGMSAALLLSMSACGSSKKGTTYEPLTEEDDTVYKIGICQDEDSDYYNQIALGFSDALTDLFGEDHIEVTTTISSSETGADSICASYLNENTNLIFANGKKSLSAAAAATEVTPVVGAGVMDYQTALHLASTNDGWNKKTGTNVTGISSKPNIAEQLSLLIEATDDLSTVGLLYNPEDTDALYQLAIIEKYLDQAGIAWREYAIPLNDTSSLLTNELTDSSAISPSKIVAGSITQGFDNQAESFDNNDLISGIFSANSAHTAKTSATWPQEESTDDESAVSQEAPGEDASLSDVVTYACSQCSALFIPAESQLTSEIEEITSIANESKTVTVGGDSTLGQYTLVSLYKDPYGMGYAAGKQVYRILVDGDNPGDIKIGSSSAENIKFYNGDVAEIFEKEFPKSFHEITEYFESYEIGSTTNKVESDSES